MRSRAGHTPIDISPRIVGGIALNHSSARSCHIGSGMKVFKVSDARDMGGKDKQADVAKYLDPRRAKEANGKPCCSIYAFQWFLSTEASKSKEASNPCGRCSGDHVVLRTE